MSGITYNGVAMSSIGSKVESFFSVELWGLANPATGSNTVEVTLSGIADTVANASSFTGAATTTEGFASASNTTGDATVDVTTVEDNDWVVDSVVASDGTITVGAGQTQRQNVSGSVAMSTEGPKTPAGSVTMSWTDLELATWAIVAVALKPLAVPDQPFQPWQQRAPILAH